MHNEDTETMPETHASDISEFIQAAIFEFAEDVEEFADVELETFSEAGTTTSDEGFFVFYGGKRFAVTISEQ